MSCVSSLRCFAIINHAFISASCDSAEGRLWEHTAVFRVCFFLLLLSPTPAATLPFPSCPYRQQGGTPGTGHCSVVGVEVSMCWWLLLHRCAEMSASGTAASHKPGTQLSLKENPCSGFHSGVAVPGRHELTGTMPSFLSCRGGLQAMFLFPFLLWLQLQATLTVYT